MVIGLEAILKNYNAKRKYISEQITEAAKEREAYENTLDLSVVVHSDIMCGETSNSWTVRVSNKLPKDGTSFKDSHSIVNCPVRAIDDHWTHYSVSTTDVKNMVAAAELKGITFATDDDRQAWKDGRDFAMK